MLTGSVRRHWRQFCFLEEGQSAHLLCLLRGCQVRKILNILVSFYYLLLACSALSSFRSLYFSLILSSFSPYLSLSLPPLSFLLSISPSLSLHHYIYIDNSSNSRVDLSLHSGGWTTTHLYIQYTIFDLISEHALISEHPLFS